MHISKTRKYGTEPITYLAPQIWFLVLNGTKNSKLLDPFKRIRQDNRKLIALITYVRPTFKMSVSFTFSLLTLSKVLQT